MENGHRPFSLKDETTMIDERFIALTIATRFHSTRDYNVVGEFHDLPNGLRRGLSQKR